jgi:nucleotide-binding universal stress UspA family protein
MAMTPNTKLEIDRILCPIDFSDTSRHALDHAAALAHWYEARLSLVYVHPVLAMATLSPGVPLMPGVVLTQADRDALAASIEDFARDELGSTVSMTPAVLEGNAGSEITAYAAEHRTQLIVLGTHGRSGFDRLVTGSVAERVLRTAPCPVLTVPPRVADRVPLPAALFRRILCAIDFSPCSMQALAYALSIAQEGGGAITVVHVSELSPEDVAPLVGGDAADASPFREYLARAQSERAAELEASVPPGVREYCTVDTVLASGKPYREILRVAANRDSDLIVLGVHGRTPLDRFFFGSTAQHVVRAAGCPVLTVRQ